MSAFTPEQIEYVQDHAGETRVPSIHISNGIRIGAATIAVILRFFARRVGRTGLGKDDYCLFVAYVLYVCYATAFSVMTRSLPLSPNFPWETFSKLLGAIVSSWALAAWLPSILSCVPIEKNWDSSIPGRCLDYGTVTLVIGIFNVLLDFLILGIPMPLLWRLRMSTRRKILLSGSITKPTLVAVPSTHDPLTQCLRRDTVWPGVLSGLEVCTGIVACCSITYRPLVEKVMGSSVVELEGLNSEYSQGWSKISIRREVMVQNSSANSTGREDDQTELQPWQLKNKGIDRRWQQ
ncbi:hypothetical protein F4781DRAFT_420450 [Annulohypoxylon bovei var. microspora]|nr:hypothetical protein F4781DRAFT_420450 [Annulohypoxylon bovei var. microspora]